MRHSFLSIAFLAFSSLCLGQVPPLEPINDGSFENMHPEWRLGCKSNNTPDHQPGNWGVTLPAYHGEHYAGLITKIDRKMPDSIRREQLAQQFNKWLLDSDEYFYVMYLATSHTYGPNGSNPEGRLNLRYGYGSRCYMDTFSIIWQSPVITQNSWSFHTANVLIPSAGWIVIEAENTPTYRVNCNVLVDSFAGPFRGRWPLPELGDDQYLCEGDSTTFSLPQPGTNLIPDTVSYLWSDGSRELTRTFTETGAYSVCSIWNKLKQCDTVFIHVETQPEFTIDETGLSCLGDAVSLKATVGRPGYEYIWSDGTIDSMITVSESSAFYVSASNGICTAVDSTTVSFRDCSATLSMPNVFSPNGDGINDVFRPMNAINIYSLQIDIFDRWGRKVSTLRSLDQGWDGRNSLGQALPEGVYFWAARYQGVEDEEVQVVRGNVMLVR